MSKEDARLFLERMKSDLKFRQHVFAETSGPQRKQLIENSGYYFTKDEINSVKEEITQEELEVVTGGNGWEVFIDWEEEDIF